MDFAEAIRLHAHQPLTHQMLNSLLKDYQQPNDKIHKLLRDGLLQAVKKGLYIAGPKLSSSRPEPFLLANHILGPSYVSLETALAYYDFIPERVFEIASMTTKASRKFKTETGTFSYTRLPLPYYSFGIRQLKLADDQYAMVATPEKALCDKIITTSGMLFRSKKSTREFLLENMRMDEDKLRTLNTKEISGWLSETAKEESLQLLILTLEEL
ncbi:MAG: hypothetical protein JJE09_16230 [Bacteroidia bacterium]|nr:hypothetical protein [Bacteroidia bacterium]